MVDSAVEALAHLATAPYRAPAQYSYACWVDKDPCPVVEKAEQAIVNALRDYESNPDSHPYASPTHIQYALDFYLGCGRCPRPARQSLERLSGMRLGAHERRLLLTAPRPDEDPAPLQPVADTGSAYGAHHRARRSLCHAGLLSAYEAGHYGHPAVAVKVLSRLTPLGAAIVDACQRDLETGARIRWDRKRGAIEQALLTYLRDPVDETRDRMRRFAANPKQHHYSEVTRILLPVLAPAAAGAG